MTDRRLTIASVVLATLWSCCAAGEQQLAPTNTPTIKLRVPDAAEPWAAEPADPAYDGVLEHSPWHEVPAEGWQPPFPHHHDCPQCGSHGVEGLPMPRHGEAAEHWHEFLSGDRRYQGPGRPLLRESWTYRPLSFSFGMGGVWGDSLLNNRVDQGGGFFYTFRLGYDFSPYWGAEMRIAEATMNTKNLAGDLTLSDSESVFWDFSLLYYPWGDAAWRPYFLVGSGLARIEFENELAIPRDETAFSLPLGVGLKYRWKNWCAIRFEFLDNMALGGGIDGKHHLSFTGGLEIHFGGRRLSYWPWNTGRSIW